MSKIRRIHGVGGLGVAWAALMAGPVAAQQAFDCLIEPSQVVEVRTPVEGVIASIAVSRGDLIRRGQPLVVLQSEVEKATLDSAAARARAEGAIAAARNRIDYATRKLARLTDLQRENFSSQQARDEADAEKRLAEAELQSAMESREIARLDQRRAQEMLALRTIAAPFNGVVVDRMLHPGDLAEAGSGRKPVLKVAQIDPLRVDVVLPASLWGQVRVGSKARVTALVGGEKHEAAVRAVDRVIDAASGTFVARLELPNPKGAVPGGSRCSAAIEGVAPPARQGAARPRVEG